MAPRRRACQGRRSRPTESREWPEGDQAGVAEKEGRGKAVAGIQRRGLGRVPAVFVTVVLALSILGGIGWTLTRQLVTLADELPRYSLTMFRKKASCSR
jgi:hypothetical protein